MEFELPPPQFIIRTNMKMYKIIGVFAILLNKKIASSTFAFWALLYNSVGCDILGLGLSFRGCPYYLLMIILDLDELFLLEASFVPSLASLVINSPRSWGIFTSRTEVKPVVPVAMPNSFSNISMLLTPSQISYIRIVIGFIFITFPPIPSSNLL